jgi:hypothetical protein
LIQLHGVFRRAQIVWALPVNPLLRVEKHPIRPSCDILVFSPEEVWALVRAAGSEQDDQVGRLEGPLQHFLCVQCGALLDGGGSEASTDIRESLKQFQQASGAARSADAGVGDRLIGPRGAEPAVGGARGAG